MSTTIIQAVKITLDREYDDNLSIGLVTDGTVSSLQWGETTLTGTTLVWTSGILLKNGIGDIIASSDISRGGNIAQYTGVNISVANGDNIMQSLKDLQINIIGQPVKIYEFEGTESDSDSVSENVVFTGVVENLSWGYKTLLISCKNSYYKRETNLSYTNASGVTTPVIFGNHYPPAPTEKINNLAKFVRTTDTYDEDTYTNAFFTDGGLNPEIKQFPLASKTNDTAYNIIINGVASLGSHVSPVDTYALITSGTGSGQLRQVTEFIPFASPTEQIQFRISSIFATELSSASGDNRSWVRFIKVGRVYSVDTWRCVNFLKNEDGASTTIPQLFSYSSDEKKFNRIADYGFSIVSSTDKNSLNIDGQQYTDDIDTLESFVIKPVTAVYASVESSLVKWNYESENWWGNPTYANVADGIYGTTIDSVSGNLVDEAKAYDGISTTYATFDLTFSQASSIGDFWKVINFNIPTQPKYSWDKLYLAVKMTTKTAFYYPVNADADSSVRLMLRTWGGHKRYTILNTKVANENYATGCEIDCFPDRFWSDNVDTNDFNYYRESTINGSRYDTITGYSYFEVSGITPENYDALEIGSIFFGRRCYFGNSGTDTLKLYGIAFIFAKNTDTTKSEIYSPLSGRNWGGSQGVNTYATKYGKTYESLIDSPGEIIEHCKRLQNWSENTTDLYTWGKEYPLTDILPDRSLVKVDGTNGAYNNTNILTLTDQKVSLQITESNKATTTAITKKLCDTFGLCTYIDQDGYECIQTLELINPAETITLSDIIGDIGDIEEPKIDTIYCEPVVYYQYNQGSKEYDKTLSVTNIDAPEWQSSYTPGYEDADGETIWNSCKVLYNKYKQVEICPSEFSEQSCISDYDVAVSYVRRKIAWMNRAKLPVLSVAYSKGKDYNIYDHIMVQLPMHTNNTLVECIIESITKSKSKGIVKIGLIILGETETAWYNTDYSTNTKIDTATLSDPAVLDQ